MSNINEINSYSFTDNNATTGTNYYRIKQVDNNGKSTYSAIVLAYVNQSNNQIIIYPNPAKNNINFYNNSNANNLTIEIFDAIGKLILIKNYKSIAKGNIINLNIDGVANGVYSARIFINNNQTFTQKIIIQQ